MIVGVFGTVGQEDDISLGDVLYLNSDGAFYEVSGEMEGGAVLGHPLLRRYPIGMRRNVGLAIQHEHSGRFSGVCAPAVAGEKEASDVLAL